MKWSYFSCGMFFLCFTLFWVWGNSGLFTIEHSGKIVAMKIVDKPEDCLSTKVQHMMKLTYEGHHFAKAISQSTCAQYKIGDTIHMKYLPGDERILFPQESVARQFNGAYVFGAISLLAIIYSFFPKSRAT
jgi:hypothetical protein